MKYLVICVSAAIAALIFTGCKPTENNYRSAYDAAVAKRQQAAQEQMRPATGLLSDDGPQRRVIDGDTVYVQPDRISLLDGQRPTGKWALAVALFKMDTNAKALATDLREEGYASASAAKAQGAKYYTVVSTAASIDSVRMAAKDFKAKHPGFPYVGLPGAPVLISF